jgi:Mce-associated membrane protein
MRFISAPAAALASDADGVGFADTSTSPACGTKEHPMADDDDTAGAGHYESNASTMTERERDIGEQIIDENSTVSEIAPGMTSDDPPDTAKGPKTRRSRRFALAAVSLMVIALAALTAWLGWQAQQSHKAEQDRALFLEVGRQGALNLTTIDYTRVDADVQRILDSATGGFHDEFQQRAQPFVQVVKQAQSKTQGTVTAAGSESSSGDDGQVLVAVLVKATYGGAPEEQPHAWRMRISVHRVGAAAAKVSNVEFVA